MKQIGQLSFTELCKVKAQPTLQGLHGDDLYLAVANDRVDREAKQAHALHPAGAIMAKQPEDRAGSDGQGEVPHGHLPGGHLRAPAAA